MLSISIELLREAEGNAQDILTDFLALILTKLLK